MILRATLDNKYITQYLKKVQLYHRFVSSNLQLLPPVVQPAVFDSNGHDQTTEELKIKF